MRAEEPLPSVTALFVPPPVSLGLVGLALAWLVLAGGGATALLLHDGALTTLALGVLVLPGTAALTFLAALLARTAASRAVLHGGTALVLVLGAFILSLSGFEGGFDVGSLIVSVFLYAAPVALAGTLALFFGSRAARELEERGEERRRELVRRELTRQGEASFDELAAASGLADTEVDDVLDRLHAAGTLGVVLDTTARRAFTAAAFASKEAALVAAVHERGRAALYDVARALGMSEPRLREVLHAALEHGRFAGYVDWRRGIVFSADAARLRAGAACPSCGGPLDLAGRGVIACPYCGTEVLLS